VKDIDAASPKDQNVEVVICPPFTALESVARALEGSAVKLGAQNMHPEPSGAYTGEILGHAARAVASYVILGHSERRMYFKETDAFITRKSSRHSRASSSPSCASVRRCRNAKPG